LHHPLRKLLWLINILLALASQPSWIIRLWVWRVEGRSKRSYLVLNCRREFTSSDRPPPRRGNAFKQTSTTDSRVRDWLVCRSAVGNVRNEVNFEFTTQPEHCAVCKMFDWIDRCEVEAAAMKCAHSILRTDLFDSIQVNIFHRRHSISFFN